nr:unnamed protein product [Callosobruchus analis]
MGTAPQLTWEAMLFSCRNEPLMRLINC